MDIVRTFTTSDGGSSMERVEIDVAETEFVPGNPAFGVSAARKASTAKFLKVGPGWDGDWHPTPVRQYLVPLTGGFTIRTTDGKEASFRQGDVALLDDTRGRGHHTTMMDGGDTWVLAIALD